MADLLQAPMKLLEWLFAAMKANQIEVGSNVPPTFIYFLVKIFLAGFVGYPLGYADLNTFYLCKLLFGTVMYGYNASYFVAPAVS